MTERFTFLDKIRLRKRVSRQRAHPFNVWVMSTEGNRFFL